MPGADAQSVLENGGWESTRCTATVAMKLPLASAWTVLSTLHAVGDDGARHCTRYTGELGTNAPPKTASV